VLLRLHRNPGSGGMSTEWVEADAIAKALEKPAKEGQFRAGVLSPAWRGRSSTNAGFGAACLRAEGVLESVPDKRGVLQLTAADAVDHWVQRVRAEKVPKDAETVPLHPPKRQPPTFGKRPDGDDKTAAEDGA